MPATLFTPAALTPLYTDLRNFIEEALEIARRARKLGIAPTDPDAYTLFQTPISVRETNIDNVFALLKQIQDLNIKFDDAVSELQFALNYLADAARRHDPLPTPIDGPPFGVNTSFTP